MKFLVGVDLSALKAVTNKFNLHLFSYIDNRKIIVNSQNKKVLLKKSPNLLKKKSKAKLANLNV